MNKSKEKFKKLILSWWFWIIVALGSYVIMVLININWGMENILGTFFAYLTQIAWIIVIVLLIIDAIKWIQKTKIDDYWKISFTILGIIGIIVYVYFAFASLGLGINSAKFLKDKNYEVIDYGYNDIMASEQFPSFAYVEMKALGNREEQVSDGWIFLGNKYKDAGEYNVIILTESEECRYSIDGDIYRAYLFGLSYWSYENPILMNKSDIEEKTDYQIWTGFLKAELTKLAKEEETEREHSSYEMGKMLDEFEKLNNTQIDRETIYQIYKYYINDGYCE